MSDSEGSDSGIFVEDTEGAIGDDADPPATPPPATPRRNLRPNATTPGQPSLQNQSSISATGDNYESKVNFGNRISDTGDNYESKDGDDNSPAHYYKILINALEKELNNSKNSAQGDFIIELTRFINLIELNFNFYMRYLWNLRNEQGSLEVTQRLFEYISSNLVKFIDNTRFNISALSVFLNEGRSLAFQTVFNKFLISLGTYSEEEIQRETGYDSNFNPVNGGVGNLSLDSELDSEYNNGSVNGSNFSYMDSEGVDLDYSNFGLGSVNGSNGSNEDESKVEGRLIESKGGDNGDDNSDSLSSSFLSNNSSGMYTLNDSFGDEISDIDSENDTDENDRDENDQYLDPIVTPPRRGNGVGLNIKLRF